MELKENWFFHDKNNISRNNYCKKVKSKYERVGKKTLEIISTPLQLSIKKNDQEQGIDTRTGN
jgi:hypothetical protein